jgi:nucleotide-binding universal stress UspA family protein
MKTRLFVLLDFSSYTKTLVKLAAAWALKADADVILIHQIPGFAPAFADSKSRRMLIEREIDDARSEAAALEKEYFPFTVATTIEVTDKQLIPFIKSKLSDKYNDLILMGLKGTGVLKQLFIGSHVTGVIDSCNVPVLATPSQYSARLPSRLIVALSYRYPINEAALNKILESYKGGIEHMDFITVIKSEDVNALALDYLDILAKKFAPACSTRFNFFSGDNALEDIKEFVGKDSGALLVVQKGARTLKDKIFRKFVINELVYDGSIPLLVLPSEQS